MRRLAGAALALFILACARTPTEPTEPCAGCAAPGATPPSADEVNAAIASGQRWAAETCQVVNTDRPVVQWWRCPMSVWGYDTPGGASRWICAKGQTAPDGRTISVYYGDPSNVLPLVRWESRNAAWIVNGCGGQAHRRAE